MKKEETKNETIYEIVQRISSETMFSFDTVYSVYCCNGNEKETREILGLSAKSNISTYDLTKALYYPIGKLHPSRWTKIKRKLRRIIKAIYILFERYGRFVHDRYDNGFYTRSDN